MCPAFQARKKISENGDGDVESENSIVTVSSISVTHRTMYVKAFPTTIYSAMRS
jgi:hypothetical protein